MKGGAMMKVDVLATADLSDELGDKVQVMAPPWLNYGGMESFQGPAATVRCNDDNSKVREMLEQSGDGRVLVVNGGNSTQCALLGDMLGELAVRNGWAGVIVNGCVRDSVALAKLPLGVKARGTHPRKSVKAGRGETRVTLAFAGVTVSPGDWIYADADGISVRRAD
ncbi:ribonuclease E activity regulator RraA [endosymbiont of unidentified scaly snail isolate Monju]|uniref:ribonuclease E activity regulator RraA n=1 Tax=endosymbiont of unidentified scaly snail isolate Monju TaxID=1248727 RepID=UPI002F90A5DC